MCQNRSMSGTSKNVRIRSVSYVTVWFRTDCDDDRSPTYRQVCRNIDFAAVRTAPSFYPYLKNCEFIAKRAMA
jgi:hypothetical protein